jgi:hypothetical protein
MGAGIGRARCAKRNRFVSLADEHSVTIRLRKERDRTQRCALLLIEFAYSVDEAHRGFATIDDAHALKFVLHSASRHAMTA